MFSGSSPSGSTPSGQLGSTLLELIASILLIAVIAVLSLPTYKGFTSHSKLSEESAREVLFRAETTASSLPAKRKFQDPPVDRLVSKKGRGVEQKQLENVPGEQSLVVPLYGSRMIKKGGNRK